MNASRHTLTENQSGAVCSCGKEWNVYTSRRKSGWSAAHDAQRTANIIKATARRHADAQNKKLGF